MAYCKYPDLLQRDKGVEFDDLHAPATPAPLSGLYRCENCGASVVERNGEPLPDARTHPAHATDEPILWRLIVRAQLR